MEQDKNKKSGIERLVQHLRFKRTLPQTPLQMQPPPHGGGQGSWGASRTPHRLPPISDPTGPCQSPTEQWDSKPWSRYHTGCLNRTSLFADWSVLKREKKTPKFSDSLEQDVTLFLKENKSFLELFVLNNIPVDEVEKWLLKKYNADGENKPKYKYPQCQETEVTGHKEMFMNLVRNFKKDTSEHYVVSEAMKLMSSSLKADSYRIYKLFPEYPNFVQYFVEEQVQISSRHLVRADPNDIPLVLQVAQSGKAIKITLSNSHGESHEGHSSKDTMGALRHVLYQPLFAPDGSISYIIEMRRSKEFGNPDMEKCAEHVIWSSLLIYYCNLYLNKKRERNMSDFLLEVVRAVFEEMVSLDQLIKRILEFAQRLVNADRASLFLVDYRNSELVSTVFDLKFEQGQNRDVEKKEIRMPINRGIAGHVAMSGETTNIPDAYSDSRFNREVDEATGYKTISILCMPIKVQGKVIGVVQMVNKRNEDNFDDNDESAFEIFSSFFGLALHHARLYDRIMRKEQKYRVALEVLSYHNTCRENEVETMLADKEETVINLNDYYLDPYLFNEFEKCKAAIKMFNNLFDLSKFDIMTVTRFILTVKKNYRTVPYHNFDHGWSVAHAMYVMLKNDLRKRYNYKMRLALFIACLCHDLDHRGYTNKYMSETASPLAAMYTTSTLEHHHFNITVTILQQDGHNIFSHMNGDEYKDILGFIRHCILATDLAAFFPNLAKMKDLYSSTSAEQGFNWSKSAHRDLAMAISMTAADLSASAKPWEVQIKTVKVIFEEFYEQGDKEREAGRTPIPMMDRNQPDEQPSSQVGFLSQICIPCYTTLYRILPNTKPMYIMAMKNLANWKYKADRFERIKQGIIKDDDTDSEEQIPYDVEIPDSEDIDDSESDTETKSKNTVSTDDELAVEVDLEVEELVKEVIEREESGTVWKIMKRSSTSWEDEEEDSREQKVGSGIWKDIDGVGWIDEEGLVVGPRRARKKNAANEKGNETSTD